MALLCCLAAACAAAPGEQACLAASPCLSAAAEAEDELAGLRVELRQLAWLRLGGGAEASSKKAAAPARAAEAAQAEVDELVAVATKAVHAKAEAWGSGEDNASALAGALVAALRGPHEMVQKQIGWIKGSNRKLLLAFAAPVDLSLLEAGLAAHLNAASIQLLALAPTLAAAGGPSTPLRLYAEALARCGDVLAEADERHAEGSSARLSEVNRALHAAGADAAEAAAAAEEKLGVSMRRLAASMSLGVKKSSDFELVRNKFRDVTGGLLEVAALTTRGVEASLLQAGLEASAPPVSVPPSGARRTSAGLFTFFVFAGLFCL